MVDFMFSNGRKVGRYFFFFFFFFYLASFDKAARVAFSIARISLAAVS